MKGPSRPKRLEKRKRGRATSSVFKPAFCALFLLFTLMTTVSPLTVRAGITDMWDLNNFVTDVVIKDGAGNVIPNDGMGEVILGESYSFTIDFDGFKSPTFQLQNKEYDSEHPKALVYKLPDDITVPDGLLWVSFPIPKPDELTGGNWGNVESVGYFFFTPMGEIVVCFDDLNPSGNPSSSNFIDWNSGLKFPVSFSAEFSGDSGLREFDFGNDSIVELTVIPPLPSLDVIKTVSNFDRESRTISYTVTVTALHGDVTDVFIEDNAIFDVKGLVGEQDVPRDLYMDVVVIPSDSAFSVVGQPQPTETGLVFDFAGQTLHKDEYIEIEYTIDLGSLLDDILDEMNGTTIEDFRYDFDVDNTVTVDGKDTDGIPVEQSLANATETAFLYPPLSKNMSASDNLAEVTIVVNPEGKQLNESPESNGRIGLVDQMDNTLAFYLNTIKVEQLKSGKTVDDPDCWELADFEWSYVFTDETAEHSEVTFDLPDETPLRIIYNALIRGGEGDDVEVSNIIEIKGVYSTNYTNTFHLENAYTKPTVAYGKITLFKRDQRTGAFLAGAEFALYMGLAYVNYNNGYNIAPPGVEQEFVFGGETFYYVGHTHDDVAENPKPTDEEGRIFFERDLLSSLYKDYVFALVELKAPDGFNLPQQPILFTLGNTVSETPDGTQVIQIETDYLTVGNKPSKLVIEGNKKVTGVTAPSREFTFKLTQVDDEGGTIEELDTVTVATSGAGDYDFKFDPIYELAVGTYYFTIEEVVDEDDTNWTYDKTKRLIMVEIKDENGQLVFDITDIEGEPVNTTLTFENVYRSGSLVVRKILEDPNDDTDFTYTVKKKSTDSFGNTVYVPVDLTSGDISVNQKGGTGTYTDTDLENGTFTMTRDTEVAISGLLPGIYTVTEEATGYTITYSIDDGEASATVWNEAETTDIDLVDGVSAEVVFTNVKYTTLLPETGGIGRDQLIMLSVLMSGILITFGAAYLAYRRNRRRRCLIRRE